MTILVAIHDHVTCEDTVMEFDSRSECQTELRKLKLLPHGELGNPDYDGWETCPFYDPAVDDKNDRITAFAIASSDVD